MNSVATAWLSVAVLLGMPVMVEGASPRIDLNSSWIEFSSGGLIGEVGGKPQTLLTFRNKTADAAWVQLRVVAPPPNSECVHAKAIGPGENVRYVCDQDKIVPDADYPIFITVYRDEGLTDPLESTQTVMRFSKRDADAFAESLAAPTLPATFEDIISAEKYTLGTALFGQLGASGTLVVQESRLDYSNKKRVTAIQMSQIRDVTIKQMGLDASTMWVVVEYLEGDAVRTLGFQGHPYRGGGSRVADMHKAISFAWSNNRKASGVN